MKHSNKSKKIPQVGVQNEIFFSNFSKSHTHKNQIMMKPLLGLLIEKGQEYPLMPEREVIMVSVILLG